MTQPDARPMTPDEIDEHFVARPAPTIEQVAAGGDVVLLDGWSSALAINPIGALIWSSFDGVSSLAEISAELSRATGADLETVLGDVVSFTRRMGAEYFLTGVDPSANQGDLGLTLAVVPDLEVGDEVADSEFVDLGGVERTLAELRGSETLLVNWSPHCGYCWAIAERLAVLVEPLERAGVQLILVSTAGTEANREVADAAGLECPIFVRYGDVDPFIAHGTPCSYQIDATGRLVAPIVHGAEQVLGIAAELAGVDPVTLLTDADSDPVPAGTRYLLSADGTCPPVAGVAPAPTWSGTNAYRLGAFHVGIRYDSEATAAVLDELFTNHRVRDRRAGFSYGVALNHTTGGGAASLPATQTFNRLVTGGRSVVRSRYPSRILRALLWRLTDDIVGFETAPGRIRVQAAAVVVDGAAVLLPPMLYALGDSVQARLARKGMTLVDMPFPEIDLERAELVVPEPAVAHDPSVLIRLDQTIDAVGEQAPVGPGRYPLRGWGVVHPGDDAVTEFSPAQAAAATLSLMYEADDAPARLNELGELFTRIRGFGLWYGSVAGFVEAVDLAVRRPGGGPGGVS